MPNNPYTSLELAFPSDAWLSHFLWDEFYPKCCFISHAYGHLAGLVSLFQQTCPAGFQFNIKLQLQAPFGKLSNISPSCIKGFIYQVTNSFEVKSHCLVSLAIHDMILAAARFTRGHFVVGDGPLFIEVKIGKSWCRLHKRYLI